MKPFNLEKYLANPNKKLVTRDGRNARIVCTDAKGTYPILALVKYDNDEFESAVFYTKNGTLNLDGSQHPSDLFFATKKQEGYTCIYFSEGKHYLDKGIYPTKEDADKEGEKWNDYLTSIKIEWEEYDE